MEHLPLNFETLVAIVGTIGLVAALLFLLKKKRPKHHDLGISPTSLTPDTATSAESPQNKWWSALQKSRQRFTLRMSGDLKELRESLEEACLGSDLGVTNTQEALETLSWTEISAMPDSARGPEAKKRLASTLQTWVATADSSNASDWPRRHSDSEPTVIWFVGVNGTGKTTSISKLAAELKRRGYSVLLAAGDTFRAAAGEQLETWAQRLDIPCVRGAEGADSSSVLFDGIQAGIARKVDFVLCDSAGRLHNQNQLMEALSKNRRVMDKALKGAPHEILLVLDANTGQNMLAQAEQFKAAVDVNGLVLTKLDGTARGGAVVAVARKTGLPIRRLGLGEQAEDFIPFESQKFAAALLGLDSNLPNS